MNIKILTLGCGFVGTIFSADPGLFDGIPQRAAQHYPKMVRTGKRLRLTTAQLANDYLHQMESKHLTDDGFDIFKTALAENDMLTVQKFIDTVDLESEDENNLTLLIVAIGRYHRSAVQKLLAAGAKIEHGCPALTRNTTLSPLHVALFKNYKDCVKDLLYAGAQIPEKLTYTQYILLTTVQEEMNATVHDVHAAFHGLRKQTDHNVHPMIQQKLGQMLMYPKESSVSSSDSNSE